MTPDLAVDRNPAEYRDNVGMCVFNAKGRVWLGQRFGKSGPHSWQFPQGGLDDVNAPEFGALRELWEETGMTVAHLKPLGRITEWLYYDFPDDVKRSPGRKNWTHKGQRQLWFAYRFTGPDSVVNLQTHGKQEFGRWKWARLHKAPDKVVPFKRDVYARVVREFAPFADAAS